jgi:hypothetical protein
MAIGNMGAVLNLIQGYVATGFEDTARQNQGLSLLPEIVRQIASRADLTYDNLRVYGPALFDGTNDVDIETGAVGLIAIVFDNTEAATNTPVVFDDNAVTEGTTVPRVKFSMAASSLQTLIFTEPLALAALSWSVLDGDALDNASVLAAASSVRAMFIYAE